MNKLLLISITAGTLLAGGVFAQVQRYNKPDTRIYPYKDGRPLNPTEKDLYDMDFPLTIEDAVNNNLNTPKSSSVVPRFVPRPQYTGPRMTPGSPTPSTLLMYEIMRERALRTQEGVAPDPIYYRPISPSVPCGPGCAPSAPPSLYERMKQNTLELQWKLFPGTRPKPCQTC